MRGHCDNHFFALRPSPASAAELSMIGDWAAGPQAKRISRHRLHLTLLLVDWRIPLSLLRERANQALGHDPLPTCRVMVDRLIGGTHSTFVIPSEPLLGLEHMRARLVQLLARAEIFPPKWWKFRPHVTLLYNGPLVDIPIDPIGWRADELLLIHSHVGQGWHETIGRWALR